MELYFPDSLYRYTATWFLGSELRHSISRFVDKDTPKRILEIGSYEGLSACAFADNLMEHPDSRLDCVDPFSLSDSTTPLTESTEEMFTYNISKCKYPQKINVYKMYSNEFFTQHTKNEYDLIYIDGSHIPEDAVNDLINSFNCLKKGGIIWMDDYASGIPNFTSSIDNALSNQLNGKYEIIHRGYQLAFRKL